MNTSLTRRIATFSWAAIAATVVAFLSGCALSTSAPSAAEMGREVAALQAQVLPVVQDLKATWYLNEGPRCGSIFWERGKFRREDPACAREDGNPLFDIETTAAFDRLTKAIDASGVPTKRLDDVSFAGDGRLRSASFQRAGGGTEYVFKYIYSPGAKPPEWKSSLGPVVLTKIGETGWWFERSPND